MSAPGELFRALGALCEKPEPAHRRVAAALGIGRPPGPAEHTELFVFQVPPYASIYLGPEGMLGGEAADRVAGFWRALHLTPPPDADHLAALLALYGGLRDREQAEPRAPVREMRRQARRALLFEHLACWVPAYAQAVAAIGAPPYRDWAELLVETLARETDELGGEPALPAHLRAAPGLPDCDQGAGAWLSALLAPVRSGMILTRADLTRAGRELDIGTRVAERRLALEALLGQDAAGTLGWLGARARAWAARHRGQEAAFGPVAGFWAGRAEETAAQLQVALRPTCPT